MAENDYWAYLRSSNELKHYRVSIENGGSPNGYRKDGSQPVGQKRKGILDAAGNYIYNTTQTIKNKISNALRGNKQVRNERPVISDPAERKRIYEESQRAKGAGKRSYDSDNAAEAEAEARESVNNASLRMQEADKAYKKANRAVNVYNRMPSVYVGPMWGAPIAIAANKIAENVVKKRIDKFEKAGQKATDAKAAALRSVAKANDLDKARLKNQGIVERKKTH